MNDHTALRPLTESEAAVEKKIAPFELALRPSLMIQAAAKANPEDKNLAGIAGNLPESDHDLVRLGRRRRLDWEAARAGGRRERERERERTELHEAIVALRPPALPSTGSRHTLAWVPWGASATRCPTPPST